MSKRNIFRAFLTAVGIFGGMALSHGPAASAAGCSGTGCNGKDPIAMGCAGDAYTVASRYVTKQSGYVWVKARVDLRWSPSCKTNWARAVIESSSPSTYSTQMTVTLKDTQWQSLPGTMWGAAMTRQVYGNMWYAPYQPVMACLSLDYFGGGFECTVAR